MPVHTLSSRVSLTPSYLLPHLTCIALRMKSFTYWPVFLLTQPPSLMASQLLCLGAPLTPSPFLSPLFLIFRSLHVVFNFSLRLEKLYVVPVPNYLPLPRIIAPSPFFHLTSKVFIWIFFLFLSISYPMLSSVFVPVAVRRRLFFLFSIIGTLI